MVGFSDWLQMEHRYSPPAAKDVLSRLSRCNRIEPILHRTLTEYFASLEHNKAFWEVSKSIRSQLKRAVRLYDEYNKIHHQS